MGSDGATSSFFLLSSFFFRLEEKVVGESSCHEVEQTGW